MQRMYFRATMVGLIAVTLLISGWAGPGSGQEQKVEKVVLAYSVPVPGSDSTFIFAGKQLGFFKEQGIDLQIQTTQGAVAAAGFVASGTVDVALGTVEAVPGYVLQGVPVKVIYLYAYRPIFSLGLFKGGRIQKVGDVKGKKIGVSTLGSAAIPVLQYILKEAGLALSDVTLVPVGVGPAAVAAMKRGEVDAVMFWDTAYVNYMGQGIELSLVSSPKLQQAYAGLAIYAQERTITGRRKALEGFLRGLTKSLAYSTKSPEGATRAFGELHPEIAKNPKLEQAMWEERLKIQVLPPAARGQWGYMDRVHFENLLEVLYLGGLIKEKPPVEKLYTTEFLKAANEVDLSRLP